MSAPQFRVLVGDVSYWLDHLVVESVQCFVSSFPYWNLRSYGKGHPGQIGLEPTFKDWVSTCVDVSARIHRVLRNDGTFFLNIGQSYAGARSFQGTATGTDGVFSRRAASLNEGLTSGADEGDGSYARRDRGQGGLGHKLAEGFKSKDLIMQGPLLAEALREWGWVLRSHIVWTKNSLPESCTDRPTCNFEHVFLFAKSNKTTFWTHESGAGTRTKPQPHYVWKDRITGQDFIPTEPAGWKAKEKISAGTLLNGVDVSDGGKRPRYARRNLWEGHDYFYDADAVREPVKEPENTGHIFEGKNRVEEVVEGGVNSSTVRRSGNAYTSPGRANLRSVWIINNEPFPGGHFAVFPQALPALCIKAGTSEKGACPTCGAPWFPLVEKGEPDEEWKEDCGADAEGGYDGESTKDHDTEGVQDASAVKARILAGMKTRTVSKWFPTCDCRTAEGQVPEPVPCIVGDPFTGSGRTGKAAVGMGRSFIGIELVPEYAEMASANIADPEWEKKERARRKAEKVQRKD